MQVLQVFDFVLLAMATSSAQQPGRHPRYPHIVNWGEVYTVVQGVPLELSVAVNYQFLVRAVQRHGLRITASNLASGSGNDVGGYGRSRGLRTLRSWLWRFGWLRLFSFTATTKTHRSADGTWKTETAKIHLP